MNIYFASFEDFGAEKNLIWYIAKIISYETLSDDYIEAANFQKIYMAKWPGQITIEIEDGVDLEDGLDEVYRSNQQLIRAIFQHGIFKK